MHLARADLLKKRHRTEGRHATLEVDGGRSPEIRSGLLKKWLPEANRSLACGVDLS